MKQRILNFLRGIFYPSKFDMVTEIRALDPMSLKQRVREELKTLLLSLDEKQYKMLLDGEEITVRIFEPTLIYILPNRNENDFSALANGIEEIKRTLGYILIPFPYFFGYEHVYHFTIKQTPNDDYQPIPDNDEDDKPPGAEAVASEPVKVMVNRAGA